MGLYEKARNVFENARARALLDPSAEIPEAELRRLILEVEAARRTLARSLSQKINEEESLRRRAAACSAGLALWRARTALARERGLTDLAREAEARARRCEAERAKGARRRETLAAAIASLAFHVDRLERALKLLHAKRRAQALGPAAATPKDPVEEAFFRLEIEDLAQGTVTDRPGEAGPPARPRRRPEAPPGRLERGLRNGCPPERPEPPR
jgi:phage shock protein A